MSTVPVRTPETDAVIELLQDGGLLVGDAERPAGWATAVAGYVILYPLNAPTDGPIGDVHADMASEYQVTAVGQTRAQAQWNLDRARTLMFAAPAHLVTGRRLMRPIELQGDSGVIDRDDDTSPALFYGVDRYTLWSTPDPNNN